jgi:hypothetical protein
MIWLLKPDQTEAMEFAPAMDETTGILPGLRTVAGKPVQVGFDGSRLTSDAGIFAAGGKRAGPQDRRTRRTVQNLVERGLVVVRRGEGTFVTQPRITQELTELTVLSRMLESRT